MHLCDSHSALCSVTSMKALSMIKILQPTDIISGATVLLSIQVHDDIDLVKSIVYSIYGTRSGSKGWHVLATADFTSIGGSPKSVFSISFDATLFPAQEDVHMKVSKFALFED